MSFHGMSRRVQMISGLCLGLLLACGCEIKKTSNNAGGAPAEYKKGTPDGDAKTAQSETKGEGTGEQKKDTPENAPKAAQADKPAETITAEGSSTVYPICQAFAVKFEKNSKYKVSVSGSGTGGGYKKFVIRQIDIWNASRPVAEKEAEELKKKGIEWLQLTIAMDGIVVAVNSGNTWCEKLTCAQLKKIWEPNSKVKTWQDLDPAWPAEKLLLFGADVDSGTYEYFTEAINDKKGAINIKYTPSSDDNILVEGISSNKYALGFIPFGYYVENTEKLKPLAISPTKDESETPAEYVEPTVETILSGEYQRLSRPLFMYVNKDALLSRPEVADFLKFVVSEESQPLIEKKGFVRVKEETRQEMARQLESALAEKKVTKAD